LQEIPFEEKKPEEYINYRTPSIIPNVQTPGTEQIHASLLEINKLLPDKFKYVYKTISDKLFAEVTD
jgi:hypothetical protein